MEPLISPFPYSPSFLLTNLRFSSPLMGGLVPVNSFFGSGKDSPEFVVSCKGHLLPLACFLRGPQNATGLVPCQAVDANNIGVYGILVFQILLATLRIIRYLHNRI